MSSPNIPADKIDDLLQAISGLSSVLLKLKTPEVDLSEEAQKPETQQTVQVKKTQPYAVIEIQRFYNDEPKVSKSLPTKVKPSGRCPCGPRCPCVSSVTDDDDIDVVTSLDIHDQHSSFEALLELVVTIGLLLWMFWILSNLPLFVY